MNPDWHTIANVATATAVIVAIGALIWQIRDSLRQERLRRSEFALQKTIDAWEEAYRLLQDGNNRLETWIAAARTIELSKKIEKDIEHLAHLDVLEIQKDRYRRELGNVIGWHNAAITGSFFYGVPEDQSDISIDDAARRSTVSRGETLAIPENALFSIWQFAQYPANYEDPLPLSRFSAEQVNSGSMQVLWPGLSAYLRHIRRYRSVCGQLLQREDEDIAS